MIYNFSRININNLIEPLTNIKDIFILCYVRFKKA